MLDLLAAVATSAARNLCMTCHETKHLWCVVFDHFFCAFCHPQARL
jgi:hypothetical protein